MHRCSPVNLNSSWEMFRFLVDLLLLYENSCDPPALKGMTLSAALSTCNFCQAWLLITPTWPTLASVHDIYRLPTPLLVLNGWFRFATLLTLTQKPFEVPTTSAFSSTIPLPCSHLRTDPGFIIIHRNFSAHANDSSNSWPSDFLNLILCLNSHILEHLYLQNSQLW